MEGDIFVLLLDSSSYVHVHTPHSPFHFHQQPRQNRRSRPSVRATRASRPQCTQCTQCSTLRPRRRWKEQAHLFFSFWPARTADSDPFCNLVLVSLVSATRGCPPRPHDPEETTPPLRIEAEGTEMNTRVRERTIPTYSWHKMGLRSGVCFNCAREFLCTSPLRTIAATAFVHHHEPVE